MYLIASILCKTDNFQFNESPIPASGLFKEIEGELLRFFRRRAASVLPPFHTSGGDSGKGLSGKGQLIVSRGGASGIEAVARSSHASMFNALLRAICPLPLSSDGVFSIAVSSSSNRSVPSEASSPILSSSFGVCDMIAPSVKTGGE